MKSKATSLNTSKSTRQNSILRAKKEFISLQNQFENLSKNRRSSTKSFYNLIQNHNIKLKPTQQQVLKINEKLSQGYEEQLFKLLTLFQKKTNKEECNLIFLMSINKLFIKKLHAYTKIINAHKEFSRYVTFPNVDTDKLSGELNKLMQEIEENGSYPPI